MAPANAAGSSAGARIPVSPSTTSSALLPTGSAASAYLLCKGSITRNNTTGATGKRFNIEFKSGQIRFAIDDDVNKDELAINGSAFFTNDWVHVVAIRDTAAKRLRLFMNGAMVGESAVTKALGIGEASALIIGNIGELEFLTTTNAPAPYKGMLDELKVFNYALTPDQVLEVFHTSPLPIQPFNPSIANGAFLEGYDAAVKAGWKGGSKTDSYKVYFGTNAGGLSFYADALKEQPSVNFTNLIAGTTYYWRVDAIGPAGTTTGSIWSFKAVSPKGLVAHYKLDETSGLLANDSSPFRHNGNVSNMPEATWAPARFGNGLQFKNPVSTSAVKVDHADHLLFDRNSFTISLWVKLTAGGSNYNSASPAKDCYLIHKGRFTDPGGKWYGLQLRDSTLTFAIDDAASKVDVSQSLRRNTAFTVFNNNWTNIIAIKDTASRQIRLYINGVLAVTRTLPASYGTTGLNLPLLIGNSPENKPFHDVMDDVRLYNYALAPEEISELQKGTPPVVLTKDTTIYLDAAGNATITPTAINNGSSDDYGIAEMKLDKTTFDCSTTGEQTIRLTITDVHGNRAFADAIVTVKDTTPATVATKNIEVTLVNGSTTINASDLDNGSADACGIKSITIDKTKFDCSQIGANEVVLMVTDVHGNVSSAKATVTVIGSVPAPAVTVSRIDQTYTGGGSNTIYLGYGAQELQLTATDGNSTQSSFVWHPAMGLSHAGGAHTTFSTTLAGIYSYTAKATNEYGCHASAAVTITVNDARCGTQMNKVLVCHKGKEVCIGTEGVKDHLAHGDALGGCAVSSSIVSRQIVEKEPEQVYKAGVYPNPASSVATITFEAINKGKYTLELFDNNGKRVSLLQQGSTNGKQPITYRLNVKKHAPGLYFVKLIAGSQVYTQQLVIQ